MNARRLPFRNREWARFALLTVLAATGCAARHAEVTGSVRYRNQPLTNGSVSFYCADGAIRSSLISAQGTYRLSGIAPGSVHVTVVSHPRIPPGFQVNSEPAMSASPTARATAAPEKPLLQVPQRYTRPESSGLAFEVHPGAQVLDLDLRP